MVMHSQRKAEEAIRIFGQINVLINSGGISQRSLALETSNEVEQQLMDVNFWGNSNAEQIHFTTSH
jgi:dehydrogenase/reductase SDR family protein 7B